MALTTSTMQSSVGDFQRDFLYKMFIEFCPSEVISRMSSANTFKDVVDLYQQKGIWSNRKTSNITLQWAGQFIDYPGVDQSNRIGTLIFTQDAKQMAYDFFSACKDISGDEANHVMLPMTSANQLQLGFAQVDIDKETITNYRRLKNVWVQEIQELTLDKKGSGLSVLQVGIVWGSNENVKEKRGQTI